MEKRRVFSKEFKKRAVEIALTSKRKQSVIAADLGINCSILARWKREAREVREDGHTLSE